MESTKTEYKSEVLHSKRGSRNLYLVVGSQGEGERGDGLEGEGGVGILFLIPFCFFFYLFYLSFFYFLFVICFLLYQMKDC